MAKKQTNEVKKMTVIFEVFYLDDKPISNSMLGKIRNMDFCDHLDIVNDRHIKITNCQCMRSENEDPKDIADRLAVEVEKGIHGASRFLRVRDYKVYAE